MRAGRIYDLIETASSFGTAGVIVIMIPALFTKIAEQKTAIATLVTDLVSYIVGAYIVQDYRNPGPQLVLYSPDFHVRFSLEDSCSSEIQE
jgi:hypothetical protein